MPGGASKQSGMRRLLAVLAVLTWLVSSGFVQPAAPVSVVTIALAGYVPGPDEWGPVTVRQGGRLFLVNADYPGEQQYHDVVHDADEPLFWSTTIGSGEWTEVEGVSELAPGRYDFHCFVHPITMYGRLDVVP